MAPSNPTIGKPWTGPRFRQSAKDCTGHVVCTGRVVWGASKISQSVP